MRIIVPVTMFGSVPMPCFVHARCIGKGLYYLLYWSQYLVTFPRNLVSSCRSPDKCGEGLVIFLCFVFGVC